MDPIKQFVFSFCLSTCLLGQLNISHAQTILTLQPDAAGGNDATLSNFPGESTTNFGTNQEFISESKSINFTPHAKRGLIRFDLSAIPSNATVISAYLSLYAFNLPGTGGHLVANNNTGYLFRASQSWNESTVTWATQPSYSTTDTVFFQISDSSTQNYLNIDLRNYIQDMVANSATNYGFLFKQKYECICNGRLVFGSSDNATSALRPKLIITYAVCSGAPPAATISPSGSVDICYGSSQTLTANTGAGFTYQWFKNGVFLSGGSSNTFDATVSGAYTVKVTNPQGCTSISAATNLSVILENAKITTTAGSTTIGCANGGLTMTATSGGSGNNYLWFRDGNVIIPSPNSPVYTTAVPGNYSCRISNSSGSCIYMTNTIASYEQVPTMVTSGSNYFCNNNSFDITIMNVNIGTTRTYQWQNNGVDIPGANGFGYSATTSGIYRCIIDDAMCAGNTITPSYTVTAGVPPLIEIVSPSGVSPLNICNGQSTEMWLRDATTGEDWVLGGAQWYKDGIPLPWNGGIPYLGWINEGGIYTADLTTVCGISNTPFPGMVVHSTNAGTPVPEIYPNTPVTSCTPVTLVDPNSFYGSWATYQWKRNGVNIPGANSDTYVATQTGNYRCVFGNGCGTVSSAVTPVTIGLPTPAITPQGATTFCAGGNVLLSTTTGTGFTYQWKKYGIAITGATASSYTATSTGSYKVVVTNSSGCTGNSAALQVTALQLPSASITANGSTTFCPGGSVQLQANTGTGFTYAWKKYAQIIPGSTASTYTATTAGQYKAIVTNSNGCSRSSNTITVTTLATSPVVITANGPTTFCAGGSVTLTANAGAGLTYQWRNGPANIPGATGISYVATTAGNFRCMVTNSIGCTKSSNFILVSVPCRMGEFHDTNNNSKVELYPNPSNGIYNYVISGSQPDEYRIYVADISGKKVLDLLTTETEGMLDLSHLVPGVYVMKISGGELNENLKLVKSD